MAAAPWPDQEWDWVDEDPEWVPPVVDRQQPTVARMRNHLLGGKDHQAVDRAAIDMLLAVVPDAMDAAEAARSFHLAAVRAMAEAGVRQFLDLRAGFPTSPDDPDAPDVHDVARAVDAASAVVYVDSDAVVVAHLLALVGTDRRTAVRRLDLRDPHTLLADPVVSSVLDLSEPVGLLLGDALSFVDLGLAPILMHRYAGALAPGSRVALSALGLEGVVPPAVHALQTAYATAESGLHLRTRAQVEALLDGLQPVPPGVQDLYRSRTVHVLGAIAVKA